MEEHLEDKFPINYDFVDSEARNVFRNKITTASLILHTHRCNHYGIRDALLIKNNKENNCPDAVN